MTCLQTCCYSWGSFTKYRISGLPFISFRFYLVVDSLIKIRKQNERRSKNVTVRFKPHVIRDRNQLAEKSDWSNYQFLLLPGSLALLTLVGMQIVLCTFWLPKSVKRHFNCCGKRKNPEGEQEDEEEDNLGGNSDFVRSGIYDKVAAVTSFPGSRCTHFSRCEMSDQEMSDDKMAKLVPEMIVPPRIPCGIHRLQSNNIKNGHSVKHNCPKLYSPQTICTTPDEFSLENVYPKDTNGLDCKADHMNSIFYDHLRYPTVQCSPWTSGGQKTANYTGESSVDGLIIQLTDTL